MKKLVKNKRNRNSEFILRWAKKIMAINYMGNKCLECGNVNLFQLEFHHKSNEIALEFHHKNKQDKLFTIGDGNFGINKNFKKILKEFEKCIILCSNCHAIEHTDVDKFEQYKLKIYAKINSYKEYKSINHIKIEEMRKEGKKITEIALTLGYNYESVRHSVCKQEGVRIKRLNSKYKDEMVKLYNKGFNLNEISKATKFHTITISNFLMRNGTRAKRKSKIIGKEKEAANMLSKGVSISKIARKIGCSRKTIYKFIREN